MKKNKILLLSLSLFFSTIYNATASTKEITPANFFTKLKEVEEDFNKIPISDLKNTDIILLLGQTGVGKSTFINRMLGHKFELVDDPKQLEAYQKKQKNKNLQEILADSSDEEEGIEKILKIVEKNPKQEIAKMGHSNANSGTKVPQVYKLTNNIVIVDCPGFNDSDGGEQEILNLLLIRLFVQRARKVTGIMALFPHSALDNEKGAYLLSLARQIEFLLQFEKCTSNILWGFTRSPKGIKQEHILKSINDLIEKKASFKQIKKKFWKESQENKDMILLQKMTEHENRVFTASPFAGDGKIGRIKKLLEIINIAPIDKKLFKFNHPKKGIERTAKNILNIKKDLIERYKSSVELPIRIKEKEDQLKGLKENSNTQKDYLNQRKHTLETEIQTQKNQLERSKKKPVKLPIKLLELNAKWWGDSQKITYQNDVLQFEVTNLTEFEKNGGAKKIIKNSPATNEYEVEFTLKGNPNRVLVGTVLGIVCLLAAVMTHKASIKKKTKKKRKRKKKNNSLLKNATSPFLAIGIFGMIACPSIGYIATPKNDAEAFLQFTIENQYHKDSKEGLDNLEKEIKSKEDQLKDFNKSDFLDKNPDFLDEQKSKLNKEIETLTQEKRAINFNKDETLYLDFIAETYPFLSDEESAKQGIFNDPDISTLLKGIREKRERENKIKI